MATRPAAAMAAIVSAVAPLLRAANFRKRRHCFNREAEDGIVHVLNFQMGAFQPPGTPDVPYWRRNLYGRFTINLGVYSPEMALDEQSSSWVNESDCQLRKRAGDFAPDRHDIWWSLDTPDHTASVIATLMGDDYLTWLDRYWTGRAIVDEYRAFGRSELGMGPNGPLSIAGLLLSLGDRRAAETVFRDYIGGELLPRHWDFVVDVAARLGFSDILAKERPRASLYDPIDDPMPDVPPKRVEL